MPVTTFELVVAHQPSSSLSPQNDEPGCESDVGDVTGYVSLGESSLATYWDEGHHSALVRATTYFRSALCRALDGSEEQIKARVGLADSLRLEVEEGMAWESWDEHRGEALSLAKAAVETAAGRPTLYCNALRVLGEVLLDRTHDRTAHRGIQSATDTFRELVDLTSNSPADVAVQALAFYTEALAVYFEMANKLDVANSTADRAMNLCKDASLTPGPDLVFAFMRVRKERWYMTRSGADSAEAIEVGEELTNRCPSADPRLHKIWYGLSRLYSDRARFSEDPTGSPYEARSWHATCEARKRVRPFHPSWHLYNANHAFHLSNRFISQSNLEDLNTAITIYRNVVSRVAATGYKLSRGIGIIRNFAELLTFSYMQFGNLAALDEAVELQLGLLDLAFDPWTQGVTKNQLGNTYHTRYAAHGRITDLENAVSLQQQALLCLESYPDFIVASSNLAEALLSRFDAHRQPDDVEMAISVIQTVLDHPNHSRQANTGSFYSLLGQVFLKKGIAKASLRDVEVSIQQQQKSLDLFPETHVERVVSYHRLGLSQYRAFILDRQASAIDDAVTAYNCALSAMPSDHPNRASYLTDLALAQLAAADTRTPEELTPILRTLGEAATHTRSWPADLYSAASLWARTAHRAGLLQVALDAYRLAISLLPQVAWLGLEDELRVQRLSSQPPDISQDAAACAIELGLYKLAVEILDGSRSVLWNTSQELRAELGRLKEVAPDLALELAQTNAALAFRTVSAQNSDDPRVNERERHRTHRLAARRTELLQTARSVPGFQQFLMPPSYDVLRHVSRDGPIIILNSSIYRCDALLLQAEGDATLIPLPDTSHRLVRDQAQLLRNVLHSTRDRKGEEFLERVLLRLLRALWDQIGQRIWLSLNQKASSGSPSRIWWCLTGAMTSLPIHACGPYNGVDPNMTDLFVSSYTPTLTALMRSRDKAQTAPPPSLPPRMLVVCQPETLNHPPLPCALDEARVLFSLLPSLCTLRIGRDGTVARVQEMLRDHSWLHISSHGSQNSAKPLDSSIALYDGELKLSDIAQERMPHADFAFLSACHSARGTDSLPDEAMHLAAGMMFAGFRSVVATCWAVADVDAPILAKAFYGHLIREGRIPDVIETAEALHVAVKHLRESGVPLYRWIPFIHLGA